MPFISTGIAQRLGQVQQCRLGVPPPHVGAGHDHRSLRFGQQTHGGVQGIPVRVDWGRRIGQRAGAAGVMRLAEHVIHREIDERDAGRRTDSGPQRIVDERPDRIRRLRGGGEPRQRRHERHVVDLLQRPLSPAQCGRPPAEHHQRRLVLLCGRHRAHPVGDARTRGQCGDAGHPGHLRPAFGGERGGLLVAGVDQPDVLGAAAVVDGEQVPAGEREDGVDAAGAQPSGNQMSGVDRNWSLDAHGRSIIAAMSEAPETQVLIAGAGPIGMTAAIELARRGIACRIVDPLVEPPQYAKAVGVQPRTLEVFEGMGVLRRILDAALLMRGQIVYVNGERVSQLDMTLPDDVPFGFIAIPQYATEAILRDELAMHGVAGAARRAGHRL